MRFGHEKPTFKTDQPQPAKPQLFLDTGKLALLNVAGGNIRNIALNAAFLVADSGKLVQMKHLLRAA